MIGAQNGWSSSVSPFCRRAAAICADRVLNRSLTDVCVIGWPVSSRIVAFTWATIASESWISCNVARSRKSVIRGAATILRRPGPAAVPSVRPPLLPTPPPGGTTSG